MENRDMIHATSLKGFCSIRQCWQFLYEVAEQLEPIHAEKKKRGNVDLRHIVVQEKHFRLTETAIQANKSAENDIWDMAAAVFELVMGSPILNGGGEKAQRRETPIPSLPQQEAVALNQLLHRCLSFQKENRPTATDIKNEAKTALDQIGRPTRKARMQSAVHKQETQEAIDKMWPEKFMSGILKITVFLLFLLSGTLLPAQSVLNQQDETVTIKLRDVALMLRHNDARSWEAAQDELERRLTQFTLMNELRDPDNDCALVSTQMKTFGINRIVVELKKGRRVQNTGRELLDGADVRFNYSIYEKGVKANATATYTLSGRSGKQVFLVVPHDPKQPYSVEIIRADGTQYPIAAKDADGITYFIVETDDGPSNGEKLILKISNKDERNNASFIVINHNYRDR